MALRMMTMCIALSLLVMTGCRTRSNYQPAPCPPAIVAATPVAPACPPPAVVVPPPGAVIR